MSRQRATRAAWRKHFHASWRALCAANGNVELTPQLVAVAREQKAKGAGPEATAAGLYWGTRHAEQDMRGRS